MKIKTGGITAAFIVAFCLMPGVDRAWAADNTLLTDLRGGAGGNAKISHHAKTGMVRFFSADKQRPPTTKEALPANAAPEAVSRAFLKEYGSLFGVKSQAEELKVMRVRSAGGDRSFVRFQQHHKGVPVLGGEMVVQTDKKRNVVSANGEIAPAISADVTPSIDADFAAERARAAVAKWYGVAAADVEVNEPRLWIYNPVILGPGRDVNTLVWRMNVTVAERPDVRELVLIDAGLGVIALHFNQVPNVKNRSIYDKDNVRDDELPGYSPVRSEGEGATGITDVDLAYDYSGDVYDFYYNQHGRDSIDDAGMALVQTVR
ncbi:MAG: hypothetical protein P8123_05540, partial [bacterium]